jgi:hypothetical protein
MGRLSRGLIQQANRNEAGYAYDGAQFCKICAERLSPALSLSERLCVTHRHALLWEVSGLMPPAAQPCGPTQTFSQLVSDVCQ